MRVIVVVGPEFSAAYMVMLCYAAHTVNSVQPLILLLLNCSTLLSVQLTLSLARFVNLVYLWCRRSLAYLHPSAVSRHMSAVIGGNATSLCNWYRLPVASLTFLHDVS